MVTLSDAELLAQVKSGIGITDTYQDATLAVYIADAKAFIQDAGVSEAVVNSDAAVGCILRFVIDTWDYGNGSGTLSDIFRMRLIQLTRKDDSDVQANQSSSDDDSL